MIKMHEKGQGHSRPTNWYGLTFDSQEDKRQVYGSLG